jgi:hypothetical protein
MRISSHIKGKPSHKIVSDGKFLKSRIDLAAVNFVGDFVKSHYFALSHYQGTLR